MLNDITAGYGARLLLPGTPRYLFGLVICSECDFGYGMRWLWMRNDAVPSLLNCAFVFFSLLGCFPVLFEYSSASTTGGCFVLA